MKSIYLMGLILILATGCATQRQGAAMQGQGTKQTFNASFDPTWRAAVDGGQQNGLSVVSIDRTRGYIAARRTIRPHTFGENVGVWVTPMSPTEGRSRQQAGRASCRMVEELGERSIALSGRQPDP